MPVNRRLATRVSCILLLCIALITTLFFNVVAQAAPGVNQTIGFQGRLLDASGNIVPDGSYNMQFKIYEGGSGEEAGNPDGTLKWTETYINNGNPTGAVEVKNGFMSVNLGSTNPFGNSIDWDQDTLWLSMNIAGKSTACTTFGSGSCVADGEMLPMKRLTATPYALNAGAVNGKTANNFVQLAQGVQNDASSNTSSVFINKTGTGNLIQLQNTATDIFTVGNTGNLTLGSNADKSISVATSSANTAGRSLSVVGGAGGSGAGSTGGDLLLQGGAAGGTNANGGNVHIEAGAKTGTGNDGTIAIGTLNTSDVTIGSSASSSAGITKVQAKNSVAIETNGITRATFSDSSDTVYFGNGVTAAAPNDYTLQGTGSSASGVNGGSLNVQGGDATAGNANGGNVTLSGGSGSGTGSSGLVVINTPTFSTVTNDANCYTGGAIVANSCSVASSTVNDAAAVLVGFSATGQTATLPDPSITTAGRVFYVTASGDTEDFTLSINGGGTGNLITMRKNMTASLLWNGSDWTVSSASNAPTPFSINSTTDDISNVQIGDGQSTGTPTLLTVDKAASAPAVTDEALLGSMYYDTTLGYLQCYEADGWGACSAQPDNFISLSPEYSNAVMNGSNLGTMNSDLCSDTLNINDGSSAQPTICGANETFNFYNWTSTQTTTQTKSIYVTYKLPSSFKEFIAGSTSLMGRTDSADSAVTYQVFRNDGSGLTACGSVVAVSTGAQTTWQQAVATSGADPSACDFAAGDSIVFKVNLSAKDDVNAYVSNLDFAFSNN